MKKTQRIGLAILLSAVSAAAAGVDAPLSAHQEEGRTLFRSKCIHCHGEKVWGTLNLERRLGADHALLEKRTDLVPDYIRSVVRKGVGSMPSYRRTELSDSELESIVAYLGKHP